MAQPTKTCPTCGGSGNANTSTLIAVIPSTRPVCPKCGGTGQIAMTDPECMAEIAGKVCPACKGGKVVANSWFDSITPMETKPCLDCLDPKTKKSTGAMFPELREPCVLCEGEGQWVDKDRGQYSVYYNCTQCGGTRARQKHQRDNDPDQGRGWNPPSVDVTDKLIAALKARGWAVYYYTSAGFLIYKEPAGYLLCPSLPAATVLALRTMEAE